MGARFQNTLWTNDNLFVLNGMNSELVDLVYLDPPFNSKRVYSAPVGTKAAGSSFKDMWSWSDVNEGYLEALVSDYPHLVRFIQTVGEMHSKAMMAYITYMTQRIIQIHRVLKSTGSLYLHCDPTASHYLKIVLDRIFGRGCFKNEIIWCYRGGGVPKNDFARKHDVIFRYTKGKSATFNVDEVRIPYSDSVMESSVSRYDKSYRSNKTYEGYRPNEKGKHPEDWWLIQPIMPSSSERTGYPTQKPLKLMERIIKASSNKGDIVFDPFCGCATTCVAAQLLDRKWIGVDIEKQAVKILMQRLENATGLFGNFVHREDTPQRSDVKIEAPDRTGMRERLYREQQGVCKGCNSEFEMKVMEVDHIVPKSKGGGNYYENYQLLCSSCNRIKGDRPMEYLRNKIKKIEDAMSNKITFGS